MATSVAKERTDLHAHFCPEDEGSMFHRNADTNLTDYRNKSSVSYIWTLSVTQVKWRRIVGFIKDELERVCKETFVGYLTSQDFSSRFKPGIFRVQVLYSAAQEGKVKVKFTLEQSTKAQRGSRCTVLLFLKPRR
jgi:hypothetical protein